MYDGKKEKGFSLDGFHFFLKEGGGMERFRKLE